MQACGCARVVGGNTREFRGYVHDDGYEDGWPQPLEQEVGKGFEEGVRDEKDCQCIVVVPGVKLEVRRKVRDLGVADVGPVQEANEV